MSKIKRKNTTPELIVRKAVFSTGFRYRLNVKELPGQPDIVLRRYKAIIFVHGCFWHGHHCRTGKLPIDNKKYWLEKITRNQNRDEKNLRRLLEDGWRVLTIWECCLLGKRKIDSFTLNEKIKKWICGKEPIDEIPS